MNDRVKEIALRWETLRVAYNLILVVETLWLLRKSLADVFAANWTLIVTAGALANALFALGRCWKSMPPYSSGAALAGPGTFCFWRVYGFRCG